MKAVSYALISGILVVAVAAGISAVSKHLKHTFAEVGCGMEDAEVCVLNPDGE